MTEYEVQLIPVSEIWSDDEFNCRGPIPTIDVTDLAQDIHRNRLQNPISVQPFEDVGKPLPEGKKYRIVAGHRRFKAWTVLQKSWSPGECAQGGEAWDAKKGNPFDLVPCMVKSGLDEIKARIFNLGENLKRSQLNILQEANAIKGLYEAGVPRDHVATELGVSSGWVQTRYYLLDLPEDIQKECAAGLINQKQIKELYSLRHDQEKQYAAVRKIKDAKMKGEKIGHVGERQKQKTDVKKERKRVELFSMIEILAKAIGYGIHTRGLAWAAGEISTEELFADLKRHCEQHGLPRPILPTEF